jgi:DNA-binding NtrC family response regulator
MTKLTRQPDGSYRGTNESHEFTMLSSLEQMEADYIRLALNRYRGNIAEAAKRLGIGRLTLERKMREYGLVDRPVERKPPIRRLLNRLHQWIRERAKG